MRRLAPAVAIMIALPMTATAQDAIVSTGPLIIHIPQKSEQPTSRPLAAGPKSPQQTTGTTTVAVDRTALETEIGRLRDENAALKKELLTSQSATPGKRPATQLPSDAELDQAMTFLGKAWRRMVVMMADFQRDIRRKD